MKPRRSPQAILFDWDGTLVDSAASSYHAYVRVFESFGIAFDRARFEATYSPNWRATYAAVGLPRERWEEADASWVREFARQGCRLFPGARQALVDAREARVVLGLVTSGSRSRVTRDVATLGVASFFQRIVCSEDVTNPKPHPEALHKALDDLGAAPGEAAYVGDSPEDVQMARAAGVLSVGIPGGFPNESALRAAAPDLLASDVAGAVGRLLSL
jgi:HAD superfamily hydrolase (TIGR01509 family)